MPVSISELAQLASKAQAGDAAAINELLSRLHEMIYRTALKMLGNVHDAEDAAQEVCLKILEGLPKLRDPTAVLDWAETITRNTCKNQLKKSRPELFREEDEDAITEVPEDADDILPDRYMDMLAKREIIVGMIDALPEKQRLAVYMYYYEGKTVEEIAQFMEVSEGTVKSRLSAARASLKAQVEAEERKGNKLYVFFPFLGRLLREDAETAQLPPLPVTQAQITAAAAECAAAAAAGEAGYAGSVGAAAQAAAEAAAGSAGKAVTAGKAAAKGGASLAAKAAACVAAAALLAGAALGLPRLLRDREGEPSQAASTPTAASTAGAALSSAEPTAVPTAAPVPEPTLDPTAFDPEVMLGQPLSAMTDIAGEPTSQDGNYYSWESGDGSYEFALTLRDDGQTIREIVVIYGPPILGLRFGDSPEAALSALEVLGDPAGVNTMDAGGGQTIYVASTADYSRLYQVGCMNGAVINVSVHDMS